MTMRCIGLRQGLNTEEDEPVSKNPSTSLPRAPCLLQMCRTLHTGSLTDGKVLFSSKGVMAARDLCIPQLLFAFQVPPDIAWCNTHRDGHSMRS